MGRRVMEVVVVVVLRMARCWELESSTFRGQRKVVRFERYIYGELGMQVTCLFCA